MITDGYKNKNQIKNLTSSHCFFQKRIEKNIKHEKNYDNFVTIFIPVFVELIYKFKFPSKKKKLYNSVLCA